MLAGKLRTLSRARIDPCEADKIPSYMVYLCWRYPAALSWEVLAPRFWQCGDREGEGKILTSTPVLTAPWIITPMTTSSGRGSPCTTPFSLISNNHQSSLVAQMARNPPPMQETLGREDPREEEMATYSSSLAWRMPRTEEPGGLQSLGSQRVGHS